MTKTWVVYGALIIFVLGFIYRQNTQWDRTRLTPISVFEQTRRDFLAQAAVASPTPTQDRPGCPTLTRSRSNLPLLEAINPTRLSLRNQIELTLGSRPAVIYESQIATGSEDYVFEAVIRNSVDTLLTYRACPGTNATAFVHALDQLK